ncbi:MAG: hypothetical protein KJ814_04030 [Proteobacteria bacterium]|nr:hypothetical protein [Pseudomonadota bacterium]
MEELQPATVLCVVKNNPIHVNVPLQAAVSVKISSAAGRSVAAVIRLWW